MTNKKFLMLFTLWFAVAFPAAAWSGIQAEFYVSPSGNDGASGTKSAPFKTLERARAEVAKYNKSMRGDLIVNALEGTYQLSAPFTLGPDDGGFNGYNVIYRAHKDKTAILSGGVQIAPSSWSRYDGNKNIYRAYIGDQESRQLYVNGKRAVRAKSAVNGYYMSGYTKTSTGYTTPDGNMKNWQNKTDIEIVGFDRWKSYRCGVSSITGNQITVKQPCFNNSQLHAGFQMQLPVWIENAYELLDEEGEWYWNRADGYLYYKPRTGENMATASVYLPRVQTLVSAVGSPDRPIYNVQFKGFVFAYAGWLEPNGNDGFCPIQADNRITGQNSWVPGDTTTGPANVTFAYIRSSRVEQNLFTHLGATALAFGVGSQGNYIGKNTFKDISATGVRVGEFLGGYSVSTDARLLVKDNMVDSNYVTEVGAEYHGAIGILLGYTDHTEVTHNLIHNLPYSGISAGWGWSLAQTIAKNNKIKYNHVYDVMKTLNDGGGIYTLSRQDGTEIFENYIHDVQRGTGPYYPENRGIYLDNGTSYLKVEHNVLSNIPGEVIYVQYIGTPAQNNTLINNSTQDEGVKSAAGLNGTAWSWAPQFIPPYHLVADGIGDLGARFTDVNGDKLPDLVYHRWYNGNVMKGAYLNTGNGWSWAPQFTPPYHIAADGYGDLGARFVDVSGNGKVDMVWSRWVNGSMQQGAVVSSGYDWQANWNFTPPYHIAAQGYGDLGARFLDLNRDGKVDMFWHRYVKDGTIQHGAALSTGSGWVWAWEYTPPYHLVADGIGDLGARFVDVNGDGLADLVYHRHYNGNVMKGAYLNTGNGWAWAPQWAPPTPITMDGLGDLGVRFMDVGGNGRLDIVYHREAGTAVEKGAYLNTGNGWQWAPEYTPPYPTSVDWEGSAGTELVDLNGDGRLDMVYSRNNNGKVDRGAYLNLPGLSSLTGTNWHWAPEYTPPYNTYVDGIGDVGARFLDLNGDGKTDMVWHRYSNGTLMQGAYLNAW